ncbi:DegV family protein [Bacillus cihuensis]|uniref:DegV family protein n=1 Tax=Bacillus cihuensis TaxID=1208599 RepID=UPI000415E7EA|nr:DegV family protein [Bacillus cihuensis]
MKTAVVTDSTAYIPEHIRKQFHIHMVPLQVVIGNETYREEIDITADKFYDVVKTQDKLPTTSQPPTGLFVEKYEELAQEYEAVVSIHLSSGISGTYQGAVSAGEMVESLDVHGFDSEISCYVQAFFVLEAAKMALDGKGPDDILARLNVIKQSVRAYFMVDDLAHLQRGGRLSSAQALIGSLLQVKPILHFVDKVIVPFEKIRTRKKAMKRIADLLGQDVAQGGTYKAVIIHAKREAEAKEWQKELKTQYPNVEFDISYFGPVIGTHLGEGSMAMGWYKV